MIKNHFKIPVVLGVAALSVASCTDYDAGFTAETFKQQQYADNFEKLFGQADPEQDWSMAETLTANVQVSGASQKCVVSLYTDKPIYASSRGIAMFQGITAKFDAVKGTEQVFAIVYDKGQEIAHGFYNVVNGVVIINNSPVARRESLTRADETNSCVANKGTVITDFFTGAQGTPGYTWDKATLNSNVIVSDKDGYFLANFEGTSKIWSWAELCELVKTRNNPSYTFPFKNTCYVDGEWNFTNETFLNDPFDATASYIEVVTGDLIWWVDQTTGYKKFTVAELKKYVEDHDLKNAGPYSNCWTDGAISIDLTPLTGVETSAAKPWTLEIGYNLFGPKGFFCEQNYYWGPKTTTFDKTTLYGSTDAEKLETMKKIESGFSITTKTGTVVDVPFIYGATQIPDIFGYVYYKDGQDPLTQPHYMLMSNGTPEANIYYNTWKTGTAVGEMELAGWSTTSSETPLGTYNKSTNIYGTKYTLAFFGENHDKPATHEFEAGYKIVFFISNTSSGAPAKQCGNFNYSLPELNERLGHLYEGSAQGASKNSLTYKNNVAPKGAVKAAAWNYKGSVFMGFEDGGGDEDLNDIVFWVEGDFESNDLVTVKTVEEQMTTSWIFAAEDLGGTWDYDFNDVVWEVAQTNSHKTISGGSQDGTDELNYGKIKINVMASGGTLPVELVYDDVVLEPAEGKTEIHQIFGQEAATVYSPVNVGSSADKQKITLKEIETNAALNIADFSSKFKLKVKGADGVAHYVTSPEVGKDKTAPQIILLPADWEWPTENTPITTAYPDFTNWVTDATWAQWSAKKAGPTTKRGVISGTANGTTITETTEPGTDPVVPSTDPELPEWEISLEESLTINVGETKQFTVNVSGVDNLNGLSFAVDGTYLASCTSNYKWVSVTAGSTAGEGTLSVTFPANDSHKATTKEFIITVVGAGGSDGGSSPVVTVASSGTQLSESETGYNLTVSNPFTPEDGATYTLKVTFSTPTYNVSLKDSSCNDVATVDCTNGYLCYVTAQLSSDNLTLLNNAGCYLVNINPSNVSSITITKN